MRLHHHHDDALKRAICSLPKIQIVFKIVMHSSSYRSRLSTCSIHRSSIWFRHDFSLLFTILSCSIASKFHLGIYSLSASSIRGYSPKSPGVSWPQETLEILSFASRTSYIQESCQLSSVRPSKYSWSTFERWTNFYGGTACWIWKEQLSTPPKCEFSSIKRTYIIVRYKLDELYELHKLNRNQHFTERNARKGNWVDL